MASNRKRIMIQFATAVFDIVSLGTVLVRHGTHGIPWVFGRCERGTSRRVRTLTPTRTDDILYII